MRLRFASLFGLGMVVQAYLGTPSTAAQSIDQERACCAEYVKEETEIVFLDGNPRGMMGVAMNGPETAAGAIFVELIRQQAERPFSPANSALSSWMPGHETGHHNHQHPPAIRVDLPLAQYEPFRKTYVSDPACVPQLRFANVPDAGADHHKRETIHHWRRSGRTWSRVPRFRKGESAFTHDPSYKPPHAVVDKWYRTEAGPKMSLAGRVEESRWQSCHSMQSGREPRQPTRSRLPRDPGEAAGPGPGPASYHMRDPWEVREVCGAIPKSRMFCRPVHRLRPQTTAFATAPTGGSSNNSCNMSVDTAASAGGGDSYSAFSDQAGYEKHRSTRPATSAVQVHPGDVSPGSNNAATAGSAQHTKRHPHFCGSKADPRRIQRSGGGGGGSFGGRPRMKLASCRYRSGPRPSTPANTGAAAIKRVPTTVVGPSSFARAERPNVTEESSRKEESYGKKVVRLLTREGDVLVTVTRRRESAWGAADGRKGEHPSVVRRSGATAAAADARERSRTPAAAVVMSPPTHAEQRVEKNARRDQGAAFVGAGTTTAGHCHNGREGGGVSRPSCNSTRVGRNTEGRVGWGNGTGSLRDNTSSTAPRTTRQPICAHASACKRGSSTLEARAMRLLPDGLAASPPAYREPGRAELPLIFRATSVPLVRAGALTTREAEIINRRLTSQRSISRAGVTTNPDGKNNDGHDVGITPPVVVGEWRQEHGAQNDEEAAYMAKIVRAAEGIVAKSSPAGGVVGSGRNNGEGVS